MTFADAQNSAEGQPLDQKTTSVMLAILDAAAENKLLITATKLVKLLYLLDLKQIASGSQPATAIEWRWRHYGPYSDAIYFAEQSLCRDGYIHSEDRQWSNSKGRVLTLASGAKYVSPEPDIITRIDEVIREFGMLTPTQIKEHTYKTAPMLAAQRAGEREVLLDMRLARPKLNVSRVAARYAARRAATRKEAYNDAEAQSELLRVVSATAGTRHRANKLLDA